MDTIAQMENMLVQARPILAKKNKKKELESIEAYFNTIKNRETNVLICGEFKRGKSSFINAFLEQDICPVDTAIATASVTILRYGEKVRISRQYGDFSDLKTEELSSLDEVEHYAKGSTEEIKNTVLLIIELPNEKLKNGLVFIDTPGVGGLDPRHAFLTNYFLPKADITLMVTDKDSPMTVAEIDFFRKKIAPYARQKAILLNKADKFISEEEEKKWVEDIQQKCIVDGKTVKVMPVSANLKKSYLADREEENLADSKFPVVEKEINLMTEAFKRGLLMELKDMLIQTLNEIYTPLKAQIEQIKLPDPDLIRNLKKELADNKIQKDRISNPNSEYRMKLNSIISQARNKVELKLQEESVLLSADRLAQLVKAPEAQNSKWLLAEVNNGIGSIAAELDMMIDCSFEQVAALVGMEMKSGSPRAFDFEIYANLTPEEKSFGTQVCRMARQVLPAVGITGLVGLLTGGVGLVAIAAGGLFGVKSLVDIHRDETAANLRNKLLPQINIAMGQLRGYIAERFSEFNERFIAGLQQASQKLLDGMAKLIGDLTKLKTESLQQQQLKAKLLAEEVKPVEQLLALLKVFLNNPFARPEQSIKPEVAPVAGNEGGDKTIIA